MRLLDKRVGGACAPTRGRDASTPHRGLEGGDRLAWLGALRCGGCATPVIRHPPRSTHAQTGPCETLYIPRRPRLPKIPASSTPSNRKTHSCCGQNGSPALTPQTRAPFRDAIPLEGKGNTKNRPDHVAQHTHTHTHTHTLKAPRQAKLTRARTHTRTHTNAHTTHAHPSGRPVSRCAACG
jgi:hypothetical protein